MKISETSVNLLKCTYSEQRTALLAEVSALAVAGYIFPSIHQFSTSNLLFWLYATTFNLAVSHKILP